MIDLTKNKLNILGNCSKSYLQSLYNMTPIKKTLVAILIVVWVFILGEAYIFYTIFSTIKNNIPPAIEVHKQMMEKTKRKKRLTSIFEEYDEDKKEAKRRFEYVTARTHMQKHGLYPEYDEALFEAIRIADYPMLKMLLAHGAEPNSINEYGETPLAILLKQEFSPDHYNILEELLAHNLDINMPFLHRKHKCYPIQLLLMNLHHSQEKMDQEGKTDSAITQIDYLVKISYRLLDLGVVLDTDNNNSTIHSPLLLLLDNYSYFADNLHKYKFDPNMSSGFKEDITHLMFATGIADATKTILKLGADPKPKNKFGFTAYCYAKYYNSSDSADLIFDAAYDTKYSHINWLDRQLNKIVAYKDCFYQLPLIEQIKTQ